MMKKYERINQKYIANKLNLSVGHVSRALNNKGEVSKKTREEVCKFAKKIGYTPSLIAKSLRLNKTNSLGVIQPDITNPFFSILIKGIEKVAQEKGYSILISDTYEDFNKEQKLIKNMIARGVDGILLIAANLQYLRKEVFKEYNIPVVLVARRDEEKEMHCVFCNDIKGGYIATEHLIKKGHKQIAYFSGPEKMDVSNNRLKGYIEALSEYNITFSKEMLYMVGTTMENGYNTMKQIINRGINFSAIFAFNDVIAHGCLRALNEYNIRVPKDIAIIGYDDTYINLVLKPALTSIYQPTMKMGEKSAELIIELVNIDKMVKPQSITFEPELRIRAST